MNKKFFLLISILLSLIISIIISIKISYTTKGMINNYTESIIKNNIMLVVNEYIKDTPDIINIISNNNEIEYIDYDYKNINKYLSNLSINIVNSLNKETNTIYYLNSGNALLNPLYSTLGIKIPIKITYTGNVYTNIETNIEEFGINNAFIKIYIKISINGKILVPYGINDINVNLMVPISMKVIEGTVPKYYSQGSNMISIPFEE